MTNNSKAVYVAMSGGVDSSVAAALLKKRGFDVVGVYMKPWSPGVGGVCLWKQDREDAMRVAAVLNIPFKTWDFSKEYKKEVADYMIRGYKAGRTPNPDVMCNKEIKFGLFLKRAIKEGADLIATGHYVRKSKFGLKQALDKNKDQSYFLWTLTPKQLKYCLFPIGDHTKSEIRKMAKQFGLPNHDKKDSQGICFVGPINMANFLKKYIKPKKGKIILIGDDPSAGSGRTYREIGSHDGAYYYTIGQRHGLNIGNGAGPYFVIKKDMEKNIIYVGKEKDLLSRETKITNLNWINTIPHFLKNKGHLQVIQVNVKIRYRSKSETAILNKNGSLKFKSLTRAITAGQSAVFYHGQELLGGGIITN